MGLRIVYHYPCPDGVFSALAAHLRFKDHPEIQFVPITVFQKFDVNSNPKFSSDDEVYMLDYSGSRDTLLDMCAKCRNVTLIDHHKTAFEILDDLKKEDALPKNLTTFMAYEKSGATLSYEYFSKNGQLKIDAHTKERLDKLYSYIEDRDLFKNVLPNSREFHSGFMAKKFEFDWNKNPTMWESLMSLDFDEVVELGRKQLATEEEIMTRELSAAFQIEIPAPHGVKCLAVVTAHPDLRSDMGHRLAVKSAECGLRAIGCIAYQEEGLKDPTKYKVSLRSLAHEDTSSISASFGGGGHKNASSFNFSIEEFNKWRV